MSLPDDDRLLVKLRDLPAPSVPPSARERALSGAQRAFAKERRVARPIKAWGTASRAAVSLALVLSAALYTVSAIDALGRIYVSAAP